MSKIPKDVLESVAPEKREEFKRLYARKLHLSSVNFILQWCVILFSGCWLLFFMIFNLMTAWPAFFHVSPIEASLMLAFVLCFPFYFMTNSVRMNLNERGVLIVHGLNIVIAFIIVFFTGAKYALIL